MTGALDVVVVVASLRKSLLLSVDLKLENQDVWAYERNSLISVDTCELELVEKSRVGLVGCGVS